MVGMAMDALADGRAPDKATAAAMAGLGQGALKPSQLAPLLARAPELRQRQVTSMMDHVTIVDGEEVSIRDVMTGCADSAVRTLHRVGRRADAGLTKEEQQRVKLAQSLLSMAKDAGLWQENGQSTMPAEVEAMLKRDADKMSVESITAVHVDRWTRHHGRQDGISPTALRQHHALRAVQTIEQDENPSAPTVEG